MSIFSDALDWMGLGGKDVDSKGNAGGSTPTNDKNSGASIWSSLIDAGVNLAGTYFSLSNNKEINDANIKQRQAELEAQLAAAKGGGGGGGSALAAAKLGALANLYQNWGQLHAKAADTESGALLATGRLGQDPIIARANALR